MDTAAARVQRQIRLMLLSRVAENLYWAGRYLERAEDTARIVREHTNLIVDLPDVGARHLGAAARHHRRRGEASTTATSAPTRRRSCASWWPTARTPAASCMCDRAGAREPPHDAARCCPARCGRRSTTSTSTSPATTPTAWRGAAAAAFLERVIGECQRIAGILDGHHAPRRGLRVLAPRRAGRAGRHDHAGARRAGRQPRSTRPSARADPSTTCVDERAAVAVGAADVPPGHAGGRSPGPATLRFLLFDDALPPLADVLPGRGRGERAPGCPAPTWCCPPATTARRLLAAVARRRRWTPSASTSWSTSCRWPSAPSTTRSPTTYFLVAGRRASSPTAAADGPTRPPCTAYRPDAGPLRRAGRRARPHPRAVASGLVRVVRPAGPGRDRRAPPPGRPAARSAEGASHVVHDDGTDASRPWRIDPVPALWSPARLGRARRGPGAAGPAARRAARRPLRRRSACCATGVVPAELVLRQRRLPAGRAIGVVAGVGGRRLVVYARRRRARGRRAASWCCATTPTRRRARATPLVNRTVLSRLFPDTYRDLRRRAACPTSSPTLRAGRRPAGPGRPTEPARPWCSRPASATRATSSTPTWPATSATTWSRAPTWPCATAGSGCGRSAGWSPSTSCCAAWRTADADPLELGATARPAACPGWSRRPASAASGVANALGCGIAGHLGLQAYLPARRASALLGERLRLASLPTLWCGDPDQRADVLADLDQLVLHDTDPDARSPSVFAAASPTPSGPTLASAHRARDPGRYVAQQKVELRHRAGAATAGGVGPGTVVVRAQVVAAPERRTRAARAASAASCDDDEPGAGPDAAARARTCGCWPTTGAGARAAWSASRPPSPRSTCARSLPSRAAEALFWVGRNAERAEAIARLALALAARASSRRPSWPSWPTGAWLDRAVAGLRAVSGGAPAGAAADQAPDGTAAPPTVDAGVRAELAGALGDRPGALADSLVAPGHARPARCGSSCRPAPGGCSACSTPDGWCWPPTSPRPTCFAGRRVARRRRALADGPGRPGQREHRAGPGVALPRPRPARRAGAAAPRPRRGDARARPPPRAAVQPVYETLLTASESLVEYRRRYRSDLELDATRATCCWSTTPTPGSLAFQLDRLTEDLAFLPDRRERRQQRELVDAAYRTRARRGLARRGRPGAGAPTSASSSWCSTSGAPARRWSTRS